MFSQNYSYAERPAALILGRRGFLKVSGLCIGAAVVCGWAIGDMVSRRSSIILASIKMTSFARQWGLPLRTTIRL